MRVPGGGRLLPGRPGLGALPPPTARPWGRAAGPHYPPAVGAGDAGVGTRHQPLSARSRVLAWGAVGAARGRPGRAPPAWVRGVRGQVLSHPRLLVLLGVRPGPTTHWLWVRGVRAWGPVTNLTARALASWLCALWGRHEGARGGRLLPGCGASGVGRSPIPDHSSFRACGRGPLPTGCGCGGCGRGDPSPTPQRVLASWHCALWGRHEGARGGRVLRGCGASGVERSPTPDHSSFRTCGRGPLPIPCGCGGCGLGDPSPTPQRALLGAGFARCGGGTRAPGGGASCLGVGRPGSGALPSPITRPFGRAAGAHYPLAVGAGGAGVLTRHRPHSAFSRAGIARCGGGMRVPGGGAPCVGVGGPGSNALPPPTTRPFGRAAGAHYPFPVAAGAAGLGTRHQPHSARSWELALRAVGAARGRPGGAPLAWVWGVRGLALSDPRPLVLSGVRPGPASNWQWVRCAGVAARLSSAPSPAPRFVVCRAPFPGSRHQVAVVAWHLSSCRYCGRRRASLACLVAPSWCAAPRLVRSLSVLWSAFPSPWCLPRPRGLSPPALLGGCSGHLEAGREPGSLRLPLAPAEARALGALRVVPVRGPVMGSSLVGPSSFGLGLCALR